MFGLASRPHRSLPISVFLALFSSAYGQPAQPGAPPPIITTYAGTDWVFPASNLRALDAPLGELLGVVVDADGNPIIADGKNCIVARIEKTGALTVLAGNGICQGISSGDGGPAKDAALDLPSGLGLAPNGDLYVITAHKIRRISNGVIRTVASYPYENGEFYPRGNLAIDADRNIFVPDYWNHRILKFVPNDPQGNSYTMQVIAGVDRICATGAETGPARTAGFCYPRGVTLDRAGNLYIGDRFNSRVRKISTDGMISTVASAPDAAVVKLDAAGNLIVAVDCGLFRVTPGQAEPLQIAGIAGSCGYEGDNGPARNALFSEFLDLDIDSAGNIFVADVHRLRKIAPFGTVTTVAGNGRYRVSPDGTPRLDAVLNAPTSLAVEPNRPFSLYFGEDLLSYKVRKITGDAVSTVAGTGDLGPWRNGEPARSAPIGSPLGLAFDPLGNLFISDWDRNCYCVRKRDSMDTLTKFTNSPIFGARGLSFDRAGNLYVAASGWTGTDKVYKVFPSGQVSDFAGGANAFSTGDGGPASSALLYGPQATAVDAGGNVYIGESGRIRKVSPTGEIATFAGGGKSTFDGIPATSATFGPVSGLAFDSTGNLFFSTAEYGWKIKKISPSGIISTVAGGGPIDQLGDGKVATAASLNEPAGLAFDNAGNLYIADRKHHRIRTVLVNPPTIQVSTSSLAFSAPSGGAPVTQSFSVFSDQIAGLEFSVRISPGASWLTLEPGPYASPRLLTLTANPARLAPNQRYSATLTITPAAATPTTLVVNVTFDVGPSRAPQLNLSTNDVSFTLPRIAAPQSSRVQISNAGGQVLNYSVDQTPSAWLKAESDTNQASPGAPATLTVTANPAGLDPGVYAATLTVRSNGGAAAIRVVMSVSNLPQTILLSQTGLSFTAVANGGIVPPQTVGVINGGAGSMRWTASATTTAGGNWLAVSPATGESVAGATAPQVTVSVRPLPSMQPGTYYGTIRVAAPDSANKSRLLTVFLKLLAPGTPVAAVVQPAELVFRTTPENGVPGSQVLEIYGINATAKTFKAVRSSGNFNVFPLPGSGTLDPQKPTRVLVQPAGEFPAGTYSGAITFQFNDGRNGSVQVVKLTVISAPATATPNVATRAKIGAAAGSEPCPIESLRVSVDSLTQSFAVSAGWPVGLRVKVFDNCNTPLGIGGGTVVAKFPGTGDSDVSLTPLGDGIWHGTWKPRRQSGNVQLKIEASSGSVSGETILGGQSADAEEQPTIAKDSIVNYYSPRTSGMNAISPGGFLSIYRPESSSVRLADFYEERKAPFKVDPLGNSQVLFDLTPAPLQYASQDRINVLVPYSVSQYTNTQVRLQRGEALSLPVEFAVAVAQPVVYQLDGTTYAYNARTEAPISPSAPARPGDILTLYVIGLGVSDQTLPDGSISPASPPASVPGVSVNLGDKPASIDFAGMTPTWVGLYQINFTVPEGVSGAAVPLTISIKEQTSPAVFIPVAQP